MAFRYNLSLHFLLPLLQVKIAKAFACIELENSYIYREKDGYTFFITFLGVAPKEHKEALEKSDKFVRSYQVGEREFFEFFIPFSPDIVEPFLQGHYSKMDKTYVERYFSVSSLARKVVEKHESVRKFWEDRIGLSLGDQEVWSKPDLKKEETIEGLVFEV